MNGLDNRPSRHPVFKPRILLDFRPQCAAICNTVRLALANSQQGALQCDALHGARFIIELIDIEGTDAAFVGHGENGAYLGLRIRAYLRCGSDGWHVLAMDYL